jgi:GTP-binding protein
MIEYCWSTLHQIQFYFPVHTIHSLTTVITSLIIVIDLVRINIKAGNGGNGCCSFLREKYRPHGGPNGGDGGNGGSAYLCGDASLNTLLHLKFNSTIHIGHGTHGKGKDCRGADGQDVIIKVPIGTEVYWREENGGRTFLADAVDTTPHLVAKGGRGGWGNAHYVSSTNQEPMLAQKGERGEAVVLILELKLLADVGLIARPNAGKSTLIARCSAAKPRIAEYPFTTVEPVLGVVSNRGKDFVMMEVPGLLEGAHRGVGLGHQFLRHAERARVYIHLVDGLAEDPAGDLRMVNNELREFNPSLAGKRQVIAVNKLDVTEVRERQAEIEEALRTNLVDAQQTSTGAEPEPVLFISAVTGEGVQELLGRVVELLAACPVEQPQAPPLRPDVRRGRSSSREAVYEEDGVYVVESEELERLVALADTRDQRVIIQLWREMMRKGLARRLADAGIEPGDTIRIGRVEVEWF